LQRLTAWNPIAWPTLNMGERKSEGRVDLRRERPVYSIGIRPHVCTDLGPYWINLEQRKQREESITY
jgi:hypothetical protein